MRRKVRKSPLYRRMKTKMGQLERLHQKQARELLVTSIGPGEGNKLADEHDKAHKILDKGVVEAAHDVSTGIRKVRRKI